MTTVYIREPDIAAFNYLMTKKHIDKEGNEWLWYYSKERNFSGNYTMCITATKHHTGSVTQPTKEDIAKKIIELGYNFSRTKVWNGAWNKAKIINNTK